MFHRKLGIRILRVCSTEIDTEKAKGKMKINRNIPTEYLLNNFIDKDFQAVLLPIRILWSFFLIAKIRIENNFITPEPNTPCYVKSVLGSITFVLCCFLRYQLYANLISESGIITFLVIIDYLFYSITPAIMYIDSAFKRNNMVELIIKLQKLVNSLKVDKKTFFFKHMIQSWFCVLPLVSLYALNFLSTEGTFYSLLVSFMVTSSLIFFDLNVLIAIYTVVTIKKLLVAWTRAMSKYTSKKGNVKTEEGIPKKAMFDTYVDIITAFRLCHKVFQLSFMVFALQTFIYTLIALESVIEVGRLDDEFYQSLVRKILVANWNIKNLIIMTTLSIACDKFYRAVKLAEDICAQILNDNKGAEMRKTCKNVMRLNRAVPHKLSAFRVFELDAGFPLRMLRGLMSYTVVLLQLAFTQNDG